MIRNKYFDEYKDAIDSGRIPACKDQILLVEYLEEKILSRDDLYFDEKMMDEYVRFSLKNFFPLALYQRFVSSFLFFYWKEDEEVVFDEILITLARGGGKNGWFSTLAAFFISPLHGINNYDVTITANSEKQGKVSFKETYETIQQKGLENHYRLTKLEITGIVTNSVFSFRTNNPKTMDSARDGCLLFDEIHQFEDDRPVNVQRSGLGKVKNARTFYVGTNGYVREGFYDKQIERSMKILNGETDLIGYFPFICRLDDIKEIDDFDMWPKACPMFNENTRYAKQLFTIVKKAYYALEDEPSGRQEFVIKRMNMTEGNEERDVTTKENLMATNKELPNLTGLSCVCGFDYAKIRDFASIGLLFKIGDLYYWISHSFVRKGYLTAFKPKAPIQEWADKGLCTIVDAPSIKPKLLLDWLGEMRDKYQIEITVADSFRMDLFEGPLEEAGFEFEHIRNPAAIQSKVAPTIEDGFENQLFVFGDDPMMRWYTRNTFASEDKNGNITFKKKEPKRRKTDGFHAFIAALYKRDLIQEGTISEALDAIDDIDF